LHTAKPGSPVLICTSWTAEELSSNISSAVQDMIEAKKLRLYLFNAKELANEIGDGEALEPCLGYTAFMRLYFGEGASKKLIAALAERSFGKLIPGPKISHVVEKMWNCLEEVALGPVEIQIEEESPVIKHFEFNSIVLPHSKDFLESQVSAHLGTWRDAAKHLLFKEAYTVASADAKSSATPLHENHRPDLLEERFLITCTVNRRLTPLTYDRNVFHVEFDTSGTGLKYAIGEALGVHGWNDSDDVLDFCKWYGINPDQVVTIPVPESGGKRMHSRTVFQAIQQQIDIFGKPPKSFYAQLAEYATTREDRMALLFIAAPEGAATFKKMAEKDTVTFADVLQHFTSARPGIEVLAEIVGDIKPRHYSIASAMSAVGDRVDLLVVTVDWVTPSGS
jgi:sulfite reductase (NADPH) flavoprotein alpha-component